MAAILPLGITKAHAVSAATAPVAANPAAQPSQFQRVEDWREENREKLRHAYWLLENADHDYAGHRVKAMEHIRKAGEIIGMELHGKGYGGGEPPKSDEKLIRARNLLQEVKKESKGKENEHLHLAIVELDHALDVH
jgi:hypothetical protein